MKIKYGETFVESIGEKEAPPGSLEALTKVFRDKKANEHGRRAWVAAKKATKLKRNALEDSKNTEEIQALQSTVKWHRERKGGQKQRFSKVRACGSRRGTVTCGSCSEARSFEVGCGVNRVCEKCGTKNAIKRRAKFSFARADKVDWSSRKGLLNPKRKDGSRMRVAEWLGASGSSKNVKEKIDAYLDEQPFTTGKYSEKMLTLTIPHFGVEADPSKSDGADPVWIVGARIEKINEAWRVFSRKLQASIRERSGHDKSVRRQRAGEKWYEKLWVKGWDEAGKIWFYRAFEWTQSEKKEGGKGDGLGHPHFHVWMLAPYINKRVIQKMWTEALRSVGVDTNLSIVDVKGFETLDPVLAREVLKAGEKKALQFSGKSEAQEYADGWSLADTGDAEVEVVAEVYKALEGKRISQGSKGFLKVLRIEKEKGECPCCGDVGSLRATFEMVDDLTPPKCEGPP